LSDAEYKTNDISLGKSPRGRVLYGFNGIGKSVLTKAIGLNVILAQAGCFTPSQMTYKPYSKIVTRLSGEDNLFKGQSSFIVEMTELRTILRNKDGNTLVLGDELCRGTETMSGTGLTVATILSLLEANTSFIFSTHMHHLPSLNQIKAIPGDVLEICHLTASYDETSRTLVYDRVLKEGQGKSIYGLEVAKSLNIDKDFIDVANTVRREMSDMNKEFFSTKKSRYNSKVYMDSCSVCGETKASYSVSRIASNPVLHTHHIKEQEHADAKGFIEHMPKNKKGNLLVVCSDCHTRIHKDKLMVTVSQTPTGDVVTVN
jgi:DNA mismatch repair protein MutS